jgi:DNA polymerase III subunit delta
MTALKAHEVSRFVARPNLSRGLFLVYGPDAGLVRETSQRLIYHFNTSQDGGEATTSAPNLTTLEMSELDADPGRLAVEARNASLFGDFPLIRIRNATKSLGTLVDDLLKDMPDALIVIESANLLPKDKLRAVTEASPDARALPCYADNPEAVSRLIRETFAKEGIEIDGATISLLSDTLGNDREITRRELEKLIIFSNDSTRLTQDDVFALCGDNTTVTMDRIVDCAGTGHAAKLEDALNRAYSSGIDSQRILGAALNHFVWLRNTRAQMDSGKSISEVFSRARPRPHFSRKSALEQQLRLWTDAALAKAAARILDATKDSRKQASLARSIARRALLGVCIAASRR